MTSKFITKIIAIIISLASYGGLFAQTSILDLETMSLGSNQFDKSLKPKEKQLSIMPLKNQKSLILQPY